MQAWVKPYLLFNRSTIPWSGDKKCDGFRVSFHTKKFLPLIGLASYPRSGNTWVRYLIETLTGVFTGSFYLSTALVNKGK